MSPSPPGAAPAGGPVGPFDVLVLGSGVAGLSAAVRLAGSGRGLSVGVLTKGELAEAATRWAQGGVAAVLGGDEDTIDLHLADTLAAGAGLCDEDAVRVLVGEGPGRVHELIALGVEFDRDGSGLLSLAREGGHSKARVVHAGGAATGAEVERALVAATRQTAAAVLEGWFALDLVIHGGRCTGVTALTPDGRVAEVAATHVVLATGGIGQLFAVTTNPPEATGDGVAMALRAGVPVADVEFVQFHPTALHHPAMPRPLLSEALRGHGALLRDRAGERFVDELAPRDVVSRAMAARMAEQGVEHLWLDATGLERFGQRFPTIAASLAGIGLDPGRDWLPVAPAAHHLSGGILTDLWGASAVPGLWAAGEVACTGVHGANRLASNSLLEGMVFGARLAERIAGGGDGPTPTGALRGGPADPRAHTYGARAHNQVDGPTPLRLVASAVLPPLLQPDQPPGRPSPGISFEEPAPGLDVAKGRERLQRAMTLGAGVVRSERSLQDAATTVRDLVDVAATAGRRPPADHRASEPVDGPYPGTGHPPGPAAGELANLLAVAQAVLASAYLRQESRGAHARTEYPEQDPRWLLRLVHGRASRAGGVLGRAEGP